MEVRIHKISASRNLISRNNSGGAVLQWPLKVFRYIMIERNDAEITMIFKSAKIITSLHHAGPG